MTRKETPQKRKRIASQPATTETTTEGPPQGRRRMEPTSSTTETPNWKRLYEQEVRKNDDLEDKLDLIWRIMADPRKREHANPENKNNTLKSATSKAEKATRRWTISRNNEWPQVKQEATTNNIDGRISIHQSHEQNKINTYATNKNFIPGSDM